MTMIMMMILNFHNLLLSDQMGSPAITIFSTPGPERMDQVSAHISYKQKANNGGQGECYPIFFGPKYYKSSVSISQYLRPGKLNKSYWEDYDNVDDDDASDDNDDDNDDDDSNLGRAS